MANEPEERITGYRVLDDSPLDAWDGPYVSIAEANLKVNPVVRGGGRTVKIFVNGVSGEVEEYWWKSGIADINLVEKNTGAPVEANSSQVSSIPTSGIVTMGFTFYNTTLTPGQPEGWKVVRAGEIIDDPWKEQTALALNDKVYNGDNVYKATAAIVTGTVPPTHITGTVGSLQWVNKLATLTPFGTIGELSPEFLKSKIGEATPSSDGIVSASKVIDWDNKQDKIDMLKGTSIFSGTGSLLTFQIEHKFGKTPDNVKITPLSEAASDYRYATRDATYVTVFFAVAPKAGVNNLEFAWEVAMNTNPTVIVPPDPTDPIPEPTTLEAWEQERLDTIAQVVATGLKVINYLPAGYVKDGTRDYSVYVNNCIKAAKTAGKGVIGPDFSVMIEGIDTSTGSGFPSGVQILDGTTLYCPPGCQWIMKPQSIGNYRLMNARNVSNIKVIDPILRGDRTKHVGTSGQYGNLLNIQNVTNITVWNPIVTDAWGDGIYITDDDFQDVATPPSKNVKIYNPILRNNRRNSISIISVDGLLIKNAYSYGLLKTAGGTRPCAFIDFEPNSGWQQLKGIVLEGVRTENHDEQTIQTMFIHTHDTKEVKAMDITIRDVVDKNSARVYGAWTSNASHEHTTVVNGQTVNISGPWQTLPGPGHTGTFTFTDLHAIEPFGRNAFGDQPLNTIKLDAWRENTINLKFIRPKITSGGTRLSNAAVETIIKYKMPSTTNLTIDFTGTQPVIKDTWPKGLTWSDGTPLN